MARLIANSVSSDKLNNNLISARDYVICPCHKLNLSLLKLDRLLQRAGGKNILDAGKTGGLDCLIPLKIKNICSIANQYRNVACVNVFRCFGTLFYYTSFQILVSLP